MQEERTSTLASLWGRLSAWAAEAGHANDDEPTRPLPGRVVQGYQLLEWPHLASELHTARLLRALSVMSQRGVSVQWFSRQTGWPPARSAAFLEHLAERGKARRIGS